MLCLPETKGMPLEEVAVLFGDQDEVMVLSSEIQVDATSGEVVEEKTAAAHEENLSSA